MEASDHTLTACDVIDVARVWPLLRRSELLGQLMEALLSLLHRLDLFDLDFACVKPHGSGRLPQLVRRDPVVAEKGLLPVEGARDEPILSGQSEQTLVAEGVPAEEQPRNLVPMQLERVLEEFL